MSRGRHLLSVRDVTVRRGRRAVLQNVSLDVDAGALVAVHGANGSGKTTLLRVLAGVCSASSGSRAGPPRAAYVPAAPEPPSVSARAWLTGLPRPARIPGRGLVLLDRLGFEGGLDASCRTLSFGNFRKLLIAEAFASGERLVLVDEASTGLDHAGIVGLWAAAAEHRRAGGALVIADQDARPAPTASEVHRLVRGSLVDQVTEAPVVVVLHGPPANVAALLDAAAAHGFAPDRPRS